MNMREKIARAAMKRWHYANMTAVPDFDTLPDMEKEQWLLVADGVLDALMEPTEGMIMDGMSPTWKWIDEGPDDVWGRMIRAAKEGK